MYKNQRFQLTMAPQGFVSGLYMVDDPHHMNWVVDAHYLQQAGFEDQERLFGQFEMTIEGQVFASSQLEPTTAVTENQVTVTYVLGELAEVSCKYDLDKDPEELNWTVKLKNLTEKELCVSDFGVWAAFAYVMYRDKNVLRNIHDSAAVFPSISTNFTKINAVRRSNRDGNLGLYQLSGETRSVGTYCDYENLFFENMSPSLDGLLFHKLILAGGYPEGFENRDWIYSKEPLLLAAGETKQWEYVLTKNQDQADFQAQGTRYGHLNIDYSPLCIAGEHAWVSFKTAGVPVTDMKAYYDCSGEMKFIDLSDKLTADEKQTILFKPLGKGEHKVVLTLADGREDFVVLNVMDSLATVIEERAAYICQTLYNGENGTTPYAFEPVSNQGESLGKLNLVLKKNLLGRLDLEEVRKVEESAVKYVYRKWFKEGNLQKPVALYGSFYRCMDFEYIGHLFYLLSEFSDEVLVLNSAETYLEWAAEVFELRVDPDLHEDERGKEEAEMLGVYFLYIQELLEKLASHGLTEKYQAIKGLWEKVTRRVDQEADSYKAAITEHYYDNAGFGPTAGALSESGYLESAEKYGELLLANIGYANDFRGQNPDRWWEALTYMIHSLWGGVTAAAAFKVFKGTGKTDYLKASYRATAGILYCYDTNSSTTLALEKGMAASTYAVAGPHLNRIDLSRQRFGQATFFRDGGIFARLFENDSQTPDWDMGEELVAYLDSFGQHTYIIADEKGYEVINGSLNVKDDCYEITSYAPYLKSFIVIEDQQATAYPVDTNGKTLLLSKDTGLLVK